MMLIGEADNEKVIKCTAVQANDEGEEESEGVETRMKINKDMKEATPERRAEIASLIQEPGYRNTGMLLLVKKGDGRACVFDALIGGKVPEDKWKMTLKSHPGKAIVRGRKKDFKHDGEMTMLGDAKDALNVEFDKHKDDYYLRSAENKKMWLEVPCNHHEPNFVTWWRTLHSRNTDYFGW